MGIRKLIHHSSAAGKNTCTCLSAHSLCDGVPILARTLRARMKKIGAPFLQCPVNQMIRMLLLPSKLGQAQIFLGISQRVALHSIGISHPPSHLTTYLEFDKVKFQRKSQQLILSIVLLSPAYLVSLSLNKITFSSMCILKLGVKIGVIYLHLATVSTYNNTECDIDSTHKYTAILHSNIFQYLYKSTIQIQSSPKTVFSLGSGYISFSHVARLQLLY